jgi:hypothetical protein
MSPARLCSGGARHVVAVDRDVPLSGRNVPRAAFQQRALPRAVGADHGEELAGGNRQVDALKGRRLLATRVHEGLLYR